MMAAVLIAAPICSVYRRRKNTTRANYLCNIRVWSLRCSRSDPPAEVIKYTRNAAAAPALRLESIPALPFVTCSSAPALNAPLADTDGELSKQESRIFG